MSSDSVKHRDKERLPKSDYKPVYPLNRAEITPGGHEFHLDDTPGNRRIRLGHNSGSYFEFGDDGRSVNVVVGNEHKYNKQGVTISIDQNNDVKIGGHNTLKVTGGSHVEISGESKVVLGAGKHTVTALGDLKVGAKNIDIIAEQKLNLVGASVRIDATEAGGDSVTVRGPGVNLLAYKELVMNSQGSTSMYSEEGTKIGAQLVTVLSKSNILLTGGGTTDKGIKVEGGSHVVMSARTWVGQRNVNTKTGPLAPRQFFL